MTGIEEESERNSYLGGTTKSQTTPTDRVPLRHRESVSNLSLRVNKTKYSLGAQIYFSKYELDFGRFNGEYLRPCVPFETVVDVIHIRNGTKFDANFCLIDSDKHIDGSQMKVKPSSGTIASGSHIKIVFTLTVLSTLSIQVIER